MEQVLNERYGFLGMAHDYDKPIPAVGSRHVAGGFVVPSLLDCKVRFSKDAAPWVIPRNMSAEEIMGLRAPDIKTTSPMKELIELMDDIEADLGYVVGDFNWTGLLNTALNLRGQQLYLDFYDNPVLIHHLFTVITETIVETTQYVSFRTGSSSISVNRSIIDVDTQIYLHGNCAVCQISPDLYKSFLLPFEKNLANRLQPYGIHHCGNNMHLFSKLYSEIPAMFFDVGWGSDIALCKQYLPDAFLNLRLSPVRMIQEEPETIFDDVERLLADAGDLENVGICCINMDYGTRDENITAMYDAVKRFRNV